MNTKPDKTDQMKHTLRTAAKACGMGKTAIYNAIKSGKLSAIKGAGGSYEIDPAELHRVFPPALSEQQNGQNRPDRDSLENTHLREKIQLLESVLDDLKADRDHWRQQATALLTNQQQPAPPTETARPGLWRRLFGSL